MCVYVYILKGCGELAPARATEVYYIIYIDIGGFFMKRRSSLNQMSAIVASVLIAAVCIAAEYALSLTELDVQWWVKACLLVMTITQIWSVWHFSRREHCSNVVACTSAVSVNGGIILLSFLYVAQIPHTQDHVLIVCAALVVALTTISASYTIAGKPERKTCKASYRGKTLFSFTRNTLSQRIFCRHRV